MLNLQWLDPADWEQFKISRTPGETEHWRVRNFTIEENSRERLYHMSHGRDTGVGEFVNLSYRTGHERYELHSDQQFNLEERGIEPGEWSPMMSDSQAEILEHYEIFDKVAHAEAFDVQPRVLIGGLGLGMVAEGCLKMGAWVDVVDVDAEVISLIAPQLAHYERLRVIEADVFTYRPDTQYDLAWWDVWPFITSTNIPEMRQLKRRYRKWVTGPRMDPWQGCWGWEKCLWMKRMERTDPYEILRGEQKTRRLHGERMAEIMASPKFEALTVLQHLQMAGGQEQRMAEIMEMMGSEDEKVQRKLALVVSAHKRRMKEIFAAGLDPREVLRQAVQG